MSEYGAKGMRFKPVFRSQARRELRGQCVAGLEPGNKGTGDSFENFDLYVFPADLFADF